MSKQAAKNPNSGSEAMRGIAHGMMKFNTMGGAALKVWSDLGAESLRFASSRWQQTLDAHRAMLACAGVEDVRKMRADYLNKALDDYRTEAARMMRIMAATATDGLDTVVAPARRGYDDVPL